MKESACKNCGYITRDSSCSVCGGKELSTDWAGFILIIDPKNSKIAKKMGVSMPGWYAIKVR
jgi:DNA-directed RNA polymerase subunit E"